MLTPAYMHVSRARRAVSGTGKLATAQPQAASLIPL